MDEPELPAYHSDGDIPLPPVTLGDPLAVPGAAASTDALRQVLARHRRRSVGILTSGLAVTLVAGLGGGFAIGHRGRAAGTTQVAAASHSAAATNADAASAPNAPTGGVAVSGGYPTTGPFSTAPLTQLLVRNAADATRVRLYSESTQPNVGCGAKQTCPQPAQPACFPTQLLRAQVSDDQVAGESGGPLWQGTKTAGFEPVSAQVVGAGEPQPILVVIGHAGSAIGKVAVSTAYGQDAATPTSAGWIALAVRLPADFKVAPTAGSPSYPGSVPSGTVTASSPSGSTVSSTPLTGVESKSFAPPCSPPPPCAMEGATGTPGSAPASGPTTTIGTTPAKPAAPTTVPCPPCPGSASGPNAPTQQANPSTGATTSGSSGSGGSTVSSGGSPGPGGTIIATSCGSASGGGTASSGTGTVSPATSTAP